MKKFIRGLLNILLFPFRVVKNMFLKKKRNNKKYKRGDILKSYKRIESRKNRF